MAHGKICMAADVSAVAMTPNLGAEVRGVDLSSPLSDACCARIMEIFQRYCVIFLRNQQLEAQHLLRFASRFGELEIEPVAERQLPGLPQIGVLSNPRQNGNGRVLGIVRDGMHWHSDRSYTAAPVQTTLAYGIKCPREGGDTEFVNMYAVFAALPPEKRERLEKLRAMHDPTFRYAELYPSRPPLSAEQLAKMSTAEHPLVRVHPTTRRKALYLAKDVVSHICGMNDTESRKLIDELEAFATLPRFGYAHRWQEGDVVVWDNRCTLHRATPFDNRFDRVLHRVQIKGEIPIAA